MARWLYGSRVNIELQGYMAIWLYGKRVNIELQGYTCSCRVTRPRQAFVT